MYATAKRTCSTILDYWQTNTRDIDFKDQCLMGQLMYKTVRLTYTKFHYYQCNILLYIGPVQEC